MAACERAGIEALGLHQLRHTCARRWAMGGLPESIIGGLLGHAKKTDATTSRYVGGTDKSSIPMAHLASERFRRQAAKEREGAIN